MSGFRRWFSKPTVDERLAQYRLRSDLVAAAAAMASDPRSDRYVAQLASSLSESETVLRLMDARYQRTRGLLALTSARILFRANRADEPAFSVPLGEVAAIEASTHRLSGTVQVTTADGRLTIDQILGTQGEMLAEDARQAMGGQGRPARDPLQVLAELRALRDSGAISAAEFEIRKNAVWRDI